MGVGTYRIVVVAAIAAAVVFVTAPFGSTQSAFAETSYTPINLTVADGIADDDSLYLDGIVRIATFESAGGTYAVVLSDEGVQVLDLTDPYNIVPTGSLNMRGSNIATFKRPIAPTRQSYQTGTCRCWT